jgi:hypothetical protein
LRSARAFAAVVALAWTSSALADDGAMRGVWRGMLGDAPIVACFGDAGSGLYCYEAHRTSIPRRLTAR